MAAGNAVTLWLAAMARAEADSRAANYPALVAAGKVERTDAEADLAAWRAIAALLASPVPAGFDLAATGLAWPQLEMAASRALLKAEEVIAARAAAADLVERRDAIQAIHARLAHYATLPTRPERSLAA